MESTTGRTVALHPSDTLARAIEAGADAETAIVAEHLTWTP
jgi:hypothetical protein